MRSPETDADRIEGLLRGMPPESEREAQLEGLIRELRAGVAAAPPDLRRRVRELRVPERPVRRLRWKPVLVVAPLVLAVAAAALAAADERGGGESGAGGGVTSSAPAERQSAEAAAPSTAQDLAAPGRAQEWDVTLDLTVRDRERLSEASAEAIRTTRDLGGIVVSSDVSTFAESGSTRLQLRIPTPRIQAAISRLSELGTITGQNVRVQDRQDELDRLARRVDSLRVQIAELNLRLRTAQLGEARRLRLELRRERLTSELNALAAQRRGLADEVAMADVQLTIQTAPPAAGAAEGRIERAADAALHVLSLAGAGAVFVGIVLSPLLALGAAAFFGRRAYRRRANERLLEQPRPASR
jgi:hypothetical protein